MRKPVIKARGVSYPCYPTAGAMLRFRRMTGKEMPELNPDDMEHTGAYLYCCAKSASKCEEKDFPFDDEVDFLDCVLPEDVKAWSEMMASGSEDSKKKRKRGAEE